MAAATLAAASFCTWRRALDEREEDEDHTGEDGRLVRGRPGVVWDEDHTGEDGRLVRGRPGVVCGTRITQVKMGAWSGVGLGLGVR